MRNNWTKVANVIKNDGVAVIPTDTLYGLVGSIYSKRTIERIYKIKNRNTKKPLIVLISSFSDLKIFGVDNIYKYDKSLQNSLEEIWPGKVSVILSCESEKFKYLHRGTKSIAFRMIGKRNNNLYKLLRKTGPLVAPSANKEGEKPAENITEARNYFGDNVDIYIGGRSIKSLHSTLVKYEKGKLVILRKGAVAIK